MLIRLQHMCVCSRRSPCSLSYTRRCMQCQPEPQLRMSVAVAAAVAAASQCSAVAWKRAVQLQDTLPGLAHRDVLRPPALLRATACARRSNPLQACYSHHAATEPSANARLLERHPGQREEQPSGASADVQPPPDGLQRSRPAKSQLDDSLGEWIRFVLPTSVANLARGHDEEATSAAVRTSDNQG